MTAQVKPGTPKFAVTDCAALMVTDAESEPLDDAPLLELRRREEISCAFGPKPLAHAGGSACAFDRAATVRER